MDSLAAASPEERARAKAQMREFQRRGMLADPKMRGRLRALAEQAKRRGKL